MAENKVSIELTIEDVAAMKSLENFSKKINRASKESQDFGKGTDNAFKEISKSGKQMGDELSKASSGGFGELVKGVTIANLASSAIAGVAGGIKQFLVDAVNGAIEADQAIARLGQSLRATGGYSEQAVEDFAAFADELERVSVYTAEQVLDQVTLAKSMGATNKEAKSLAVAASNMAAVFGGPMETQTRALAQTLNGDLGKLAKLVPELKNLTQEQLRSGEALAIVNDKFSGAAQAQVEGYAGKVDLLSKAWGKFEEETGRVIINNSSLISAVEASTNALFSMATVMQDLNTVINGAALNDEQYSEMLDTLALKYGQLTTRIEVYQQSLEKFNSGDMGWLEKMTFDADSAREMVSKLSQEQQKLFEQMNQSRSVDSATVEDNTPGRVADDKTVQARATAIEQLKVLELEYAAWMQEQKLLSTEITAENFQLELEALQAAEQAKIDAKYAAEAAKVAAVEDSVARENQLLALQVKKQTDSDKMMIETRKKVSQQQIVLEQQKQAAILGAMGAGLEMAAAFAKDGSTTQFLIQKAAATAEAIIATQQAAAKALAIDPSGSLSSWAYAQGAMRIAAIAATTIKGFATGGIVDSSSRVGDQNLIRVNGGEAVLTDSQQKRFMDLANGTKSPDGSSEMIERILEAIEARPVVISIDGREIARSVREQKEMGFAV